MELTTEALFLEELARDLVCEICGAIALSYPPRHPLLLLMTHDEKTWLKALP